MGTDADRGIYFTNGIVIDIINRLKIWYVFEGDYRENIQ